MTALPFLALISSGDSNCLRRRLHETQNINFSLLWSFPQVQDNLLFRHSLLGWSEAEHAHSPLSCVEYTCLKNNLKNIRLAFLIFSNILRESLTLVSHLFRNIFLNYPKMIIQSSLCVLFIKYYVPREKKQEEEKTI